MRDMRGPNARLAAVLLVGLAAVLVGTYGVYLAPAEARFDGAFGFATIRFVYGLLWLPLLALLYRRDPGSWMWVLVLGYLVAHSLRVVFEIRLDVAWTVGLVVGPLSAVVLLHLCLAFPTGRLRDAIDRSLVWPAYVIVLPIGLLGAMVTEASRLEPCVVDWCPRNLLLIAPDAAMADLGRLTGLAAPVLAAGAIVELVRHFRRAPRAARRALLPIILGMPVVFAILGSFYVFPALGRPDIQQFFDDNGLVDLPQFLPPLLFLFGAVLTRLGRDAMVELAIALGRGVQLGGLEAAIARALRDPTLRLAFPAPMGDGLVDPEGVPFAAASGQATVRLERDGELLAMIAYDPVLDREDRGLVEAVGNVARLALANERLSAQVRAQLVEVRASRRRIVQAADAERRRVERDLHDGAQQRLVALAMRLELARESTTGASTLIDETTSELTRAIAEVRGLARGLHPPILTEAGLRAAVESLAERTPIPVEIDLPDDRFDQAVEATAYHVIAEALAAIARRPGANRARVAGHVEGTHLALSVEDLGAPEAEPDAAQASAIRALLDRVSAVGGSLRVEQAPVGTRIRAEVPV
jgi:signal transduction histidine kinase